MNFENMTFLQVEDALDRIACEKMGVEKDRFGDPFGVTEPRFEAAKRFPDEAEKLWAGIGDQSISLQQYAAGWVKIIEKMQSIIFLNRVEKNLLKS